MSIRPKLPEDKKPYRRNFCSLKRFFSWVIFFMFLGVIGVGYCFRSQIKARLDELCDQRVHRIEFESDGVLDAKWIKQKVSIRKDANIMSVDIHQIGHELAGHSQVKSVAVSRKFPNVIKISIKEHIPIMRIKVLDGVIRKEMLIDEEGIVFHGENFTPFELKSIPFLSGVVLKRDQTKRYSPIENMEKVCRLLSLAKQKYWPIYTQMEVISMEKLSAKDHRPWSKIIIKSRFAQEVVFKDENFEEQLKRLDFIVNTPFVREKLPVKRIDLTLKDDAVLKLRES